MPALGKPSNHPIYPRPVSPLHYEPLYTRPEDVLWEQDSAGDRSDNDEVVRAAKRRRIEKLGEAYLRGDGLLILSAGIRGPLGDGWINPWKKRKRRKGVSGRAGSDVQRKAEVPETVQRADVGRDDEQAKAVLHTKKPKIEVAIHTVEQKRSIPAVQELEDARHLHGQHDPFAANANIPKSKKTPEEPHPESWLKKDRFDVRSPRDIYAEDAQLQLSSPSSRSKPPCPSERTASPKAEYDAPQPPILPLPDASDGRAETMIKLLRRRNDPPKSPISHRAQHIADARMDKQPQPTSCEAERPAPPEPTEPSTNSDTQERVENKTVEQTTTNPDESNGQKPPLPPAQASSVERNTLQTQNSLAQELSASVFLSAIDEPDVRTSPPLISSNDNDPALSKQQEREQGPIDAHRMPPPTLSTVTSNTTVVSVLPSAQAEPRAHAPPPNESLLSTGDKLSEKTHDHLHCDENISFQFSTQAAIVAAHCQLQNELTTPQSPNDQLAAAITSNPSTTKAKSKSGITLFSAFNKPGKTPLADGSPNTQKMLNAVTPFDLHTTIKKGFPSIPPADAESPTLANCKAVTKGTRRKVRKKASFAPDAASTAGSNSGSSQGSIKASLKVCKHAAEMHSLNSTKKAENRGVAASAGSTGPEVSEFGKLGLDMETSVEDQVDEPEPALPATTGGGEEEEKEGEEEEVTAVVDSFSLSKHTSTNQTWCKTTTTSESAGAKQDAQMAGPAGMAILPHHVPLQQSDTSISNARDRASGIGGALEEDGNENENENEGEGQKTFDLSAAMDEVGSFLQSWDTEREVRQIKRSQFQSMDAKENHIETDQRRMGTGNGNGKAIPELRTSLRQLRHRSRR
ncbi:hypothetical protein EPUS_02750 [Endocarpon pusillum Z07020]|uniref:Uncharacterized protein n=1 Tax=Endocarpon pusillum (strain Z07020 / HMAS-L-300199) TaxID=1263415 RepID=U1HHG7_ENDPU|nr:uncharacterized protein EPUS_02750 [Endocarpon pusillum Z07020]ERF68294.1 hypothetical protein EPUS_02750 [Endocarpon pusillum Z07020]